MKKIALDLDGVVLDSESLYRVYLELYDVDILKENHNIDNSNDNWKKRYNWRESDYIVFKKMFNNTILTNANIMAGCDVIINKLKSKYNFIIVTAKTNEELSLAMPILSKIGLDNVKIYNDDHYKIDKLINENVDYIIEDNNEICLNASKFNIKSFYLKNTAASKIDDPNIINVNNWGEIYKYLMLNDKSER